VIIVAFRTPSLSRKTRKLERHESDFSQTETLTDGSRMDTVDKT
jgi:hypothetical protein